MTNTATTDRSAATTEPKRYVQLPEANLTDEQVRDAMDRVDVMLAKKAAQPGR